MYIRDNCTCSQYFKFSIYNLLTLVKETLRPDISDISDEFGSRLKLQHGGGWSCNWWCGGQHSLRLNNPRRVATRAGNNRKHFKPLPFDANGIRKDANMSSYVISYMTVKPVRPSWAWGWAGVVTYRTCPSHTPPPPSTKAQCHITSH